MKFAKKEWLISILAIVSILIIGFFVFSPREKKVLPPEPTVVLTITPEGQEFVNNVEWLAKTLYFEGRNQPSVGRLAIINVVINRANKDHMSIGEVVTKSCSDFPWPCSKLQSNKTWEEIKSPVDKKAWQDAFSLANQVLSLYNEHIEFYIDVTSGSTFYHSTKVNPSWAHNKNFHKTVQINDHIFYRKD